MKEDKTENYLSNYEKAIYTGKRLSKGEELVKKQMLAETLAETLGVEINDTLPDGTVVTLTVAQKLVNETIIDAIKNPSTTKLKDLSVIKGENKNDNSVSIDIKGLFKGIEADDTNS